MEQVAIIMQLLEMGGVACTEIVKGITRKAKESHVTETYWWQIGEEAISLFRFTPQS